MSSNYESFRTALTVNLCTVISDPAQMNAVLQMVDVTMRDYQVTSKPVEIIPTGGIPDVVRYFLASKAVANLSRGTIRQYNYKLVNFFSKVNKPYTDVQTNDIRLYLYACKMERNASDQYLDNIRIVINTFFQWLVDNEYITRNPCAKIDKIKHQQTRRQPLSTLCLEDLRQKCADPREKAVIDFLYSTGCRVSECSAVCLSDINWDDNSVLIRHGKGDKQRVVYFNDESKISLRRYLDGRRYDASALFASDRRPHNALGPHTLQSIVHDIGSRAGIHVHPHILRHTFATVGLRNGMAVNELQALLGHANPQTTMIYAEQDKSQLQMGHRKAFS